MSFLPIVERELRLRARRLSTYLVRAAAALLAGVIAAGMLVAHWIFAAGPMLGSAMFLTLAWLAFVYSFLEGARNTADALSEEKREGTLGLLFLTDLKGYDVVLGKFAAASLNAFYGLLALLPVLGLPLLLGGVTPGEFWRIALALINTLFFTLAAGTLVSTMSRQQGRAWAGTFALVLLFTVVPVVAKGLIELLLQAASVGLWSTLPAESLRALADGIMRSSPATTFFAAFETGYRGSPGNFWWSLLVTHGFGWLFLALASWLLPRAWQDAPTAVETWVTRIWKRIRSPREAARRVALRAQLLENNPAYWLAARRGAARLFPWVLALLALGVGALILTLPASAGLLSASWLLWPTQLGFKIAVALHSCRFFTEARMSGALELLLVTPLRVKDILRGQWLALHRVFFAPLIVLLANSFVCALVPSLSVNMPAGSGLPFGIPFYAFMSLMAIYGAATLLTNVLAIFYFGMWLALTLKKPNQAAGLTLLFVVLLPSFVFCLPGIATDLFFILWAKYKLETELRWRAVPRPMEWIAPDSRMPKPPVIPS